MYGNVSFIIWTKKILEKSFWFNSSHSSICKIYLTSYSSSGLLIIKSEANSCLKNCMFLKVEWFLYLAEVLLILHNSWSQLNSNCFETRAWYKRIFYNKIRNSKYKIYIAWYFLSSTTGEKKIKLFVNHLRTSFIFSWIKNISFTFSLSSSQNFLPLFATKSLKTNDVPKTYLTLLDKIHMLEINVEEIISFPCNQAPIPQSSESHCPLSMNGVVILK